MLELDYTSAYYEPPDAESPSNDWAHCGPRSFAAALEIPIADAKRHFLGIEGRGYVNPSQMQAALRSFGAPFTVRTPGIEWAASKLVLIQINGPWMLPGVSPKAAYRYTHWIASRSPSPGQTWVYDCNVGFWIDRRDWASKVVTQIIEHHRRADGWGVRQAMFLGTGVQV